MIAALLVDLGNVVVPFDHDRMWHQMGSLAGVPAAVVRRAWEASMFDALERGKLADDEFHRGFESTFEVSVASDDLAMAVGDIFTIDRQVVAVLDQARRAGVATVGFSNTCALHVRHLGAMGALDQLDELVLSYEVGARKPEDAMFAAAAARLADLGVAPGACFYTDDIAAYVEAGRRRGFDGEVFTGAGDLIASLRIRGLSLVPDDT